MPHLRLKSMPPPRSGVGRSTIRNRTSRTASPPAASTSSGPGTSSGSEPAAFATGTPIATTATRNSRMSMNPSASHALALALPPAIPPRLTSMPYHGRNSAISKTAPLAAAIWSPTESFDVSTRASLGLRPHSTSGTEPMQRSARKQTDVLAARPALREGAQRRFRVVLVEQPHAVVRLAVHRVAQQRAEALVEHRLGGGHGRARVACEQVGPVLDAAVERIGGDQFGGEPMPAGPVRVARLAAQQQLARGALTEYLGQQQAAGVARHQADADLGRDQPHAVGAEAQVA